MRLSFFGHVHEEMFSNIRAWESNRSIGVNHWTAALTTYSEKLVPAYPSFRRFIVDAETFLPVEIETYVMYINEDEPEFKFSHELTELYKIPDLSPNSFDELSLRLATEESLSYIF